jgi:outer membrane immunogenic protein
MTTLSITPSWTASISRLCKVRLASVLLACAASFAVSHVATAADLKPILKAPPPPAPVFSWTGFYAGANVGYSFGSAHNDFNAFAPNLGVVPCPPAGLSLCAAGSDSDSLKGAIGGLQAGYNRQFGSYVAGIETDIQISGQKGSGSFALSLPSSTPPAVMSVNTSESLDWLGTLRGRLGITSDRWLVYGTGGLAYGHVKTSGSAAVTAAPPAGIFACVTASGCPFLPFAAWGASQTKVGWTAGFGVERVIGNDHWSVRLEYLYVDLGRVNASFATPPLCIGNGTATTATCANDGAGSGTNSIHVTDNIVRVGGNYRF